VEQVGASGRGDEGRQKQEGVHGGGC
jgi:hypothetical protein